MILWHTGVTLVLFLRIFKDRNADLRFLLIGSLIPDIVDKFLYLVLITDDSRTYGHTLIFAVVVLFIIMIGTKRDNENRKRYLLIPIALLFHLLLDEMWMFKETLFWPLFNASFSINMSSADSLLDLLIISVGKIEILLKEIIGAVCFFISLNHEKSFKNNLSNFFKSGKF